MGVTLGIVGAVPAGPVGVVRGDRTARIQKQLGQLESASAAVHPALHAAALALSRGVERVVVSTVGRPADALQALYTAEPQLRVVVAPGVVALEDMKALAEVQQSASACLWLDAPAQDAAQVRRRLPVPAQRLRFIGPSPVRGMVPGKRVVESVPAACLVGPLHLGVPDMGAGWELPTMDAQEADELRRTGGGRLVLAGFRKLLTLEAPPPAGDAATPASLPERMRRALDAATAHYFDGRPDDVGLRKSLERATSVVLSEFQRRGELTSFTVHALTGPVVEISYRTPRRVSEVRVRLHPTA